MFFIPIGDDNPTRNRPIVTWLLLAANVIIFLVFGFQKQYQEMVLQYGFIPSQAAPVTYFTSIFLHGSIFHLIGNMLYLYIVGDNVEDKLGHLGFLVFYLLSGAAANFFHMHMVNEQMLNVPCIGASGAISAVLGAYLLMFPRNKITFFYFIFIVFFIKWGKFKLASFWAIGLWFVMQLFSHGVSGGYSPVAYGAHIGGFVMSFIILGPLVLTGGIKVFWHKEQTLRDLAVEDGDIPVYNDEGPQPNSDGSFGVYKAPYNAGESYEDPYQTAMERQKQNKEDDYW